MDVGIGLPNTVPWADGRGLIEWARRADARGFSSLATIGRVAYPGHDELVALAAAAGATERIGLMTDILLVPTRNPVLLAKQAASVDLLSGGRLTLGVAVGGRPDDYEATGATWSDRGRRLDGAVETMRRIWAGEPVGGADRPLVARMLRDDGIPLLFGGTNDRTIDRVIGWGVGWTAGGGGPDATAAFAARVREAWSSADRPGAPRIVSLAYAALGDGVDVGRAYLRDYYAFAPPYAERVAASMLPSPEAVAEALDRYRSADVDELILMGTVADPEQVDLLADAAL